MTEKRDKPGHVCQAEEQAIKKQDAVGWRWEPNKRKRDVDVIHLRCNALIVSFLSPEFRIQ